MKRLPPPEPVKFLNFKEHIEYTKKKYNFKIYLLRELKKLGYNKEKFKYFFESSILSTMLYGFTAWCSAH